jgi:hypothetical protein
MLKKPPMVYGLSAASGSCIFFAEIPVVRSIKRQAGSGAILIFDACDADGGRTPRNEDSKGDFCAKKSPPKETVASEALAVEHKIVVMVGTSGRRRRSVAHNHWYPHANEASSGFPVHGCLVSPSSKRAYILPPSEPC